MTTANDSPVPPWVVRHVLVGAVILSISMAVVKGIWMTTLSELYGPLDLVVWLGLSVCLVVLFVFYTKSGAF
jgi:hypothetical protein